MFLGYRAICAYGKYWAIERIVIGACGSGFPSGHTAGQKESSKSKATKTKSPLLELWNLAGRMAKFQSRCRRPPEANA